MLDPSPLHLQSLRLQDYMRLAGIPPWLSTTKVSGFYFPDQNIHVSQHMRCSMMPNTLVVVVFVMVLMPSFQLCHGR